MKGRVLVACVGNIFLGDDGFGVEVARRLAGLPIPEGSGSSTTAPAACTSPTTWPTATRRRSSSTPRRAAGSRARSPWPRWTRPAPNPRGRDRCGQLLFDGHGMQPDVVFGMLGLLGAQAGRIVVVGCEPASVDYGMELSEPVAAAVDEAVRIVLDMAAALAQDTVKG